ncbi:MAG: DNA adenine methylase [Clostridiales bacterium]|nr:DNA adenine methylase [Clostridiales bacterium]
MFEEEIVFLENDKFGVVSDDTTRIGTIVNVLKNFKNPYIGNKRKLIPFLVDVIEKHNIKYETVLDLFSGSAFVSMAFKMLGKSVISNDILSCSYLNALAFVENNNVKLSQEDKDYLFLEGNNDDNQIIVNDKYSNRISNVEMNIISSYYSNVYSKWGNPAYGSHIKGALAIAYMQNYIIENCFVGGRLNSGQILATYEHRVSHSRNKGNHMFWNGNCISYSGMRWQNPIFPTDINSHKCYNMDAIDLLKNIKPVVDLVYIDPPYGGSQSDYGFMYALFEEMLHGDSYEKIEKERFGASRFIKKNNYKNNFEQL